MFLRIVGLWIELPQPRDVSPESAAAVQETVRRPARRSVRVTTATGGPRPIETVLKTPIGPVLSGISRLGDRFRSAGTGPSPILP